MKNGPYILVLAPVTYPGKKYRDRYVYEHQLVWWQNTGQTVSDGYLIHHKNENKHDNQYSNLELKTIGAHTREHAQPVEWAEKICAWCNNKFAIKARTVRSRSKIGQINFYCGRSHQVKDQQRIIRLKKNRLNLIKNQMAR